MSEVSTASIYMHLIAGAYNQLGPQYDNYELIAVGTTVNKEMYSDIFHHLRIAVRRKHPQKIENQQLVSPSQQCSSTLVSCGQDFVSKEQCNNAGASFILSRPGSS
jgi:hypothetical protein